MWPGAIKQVKAAVQRSLIMLILLALLFLIGLVILTAASKTAIGGEKKKSALVDLKTDLLARLNASEELMNSRHKSSEFFEPLEIRKPRVPPEEFFEPDPLIDIDEAPVLDANAICRLTGLPINECDCENCSLFRKSKR